MNKVAAIRFKFVYLDSPESQRRMTMAYGRIFDLARKRLTLASSSTPEYIGSNGRIPDSGGSSRKAQGKEDNHISDVPSRQDPSGEVWEGMENKRQVTHGIITRKGD